MKWIFCALLISFAGHLPAQEVTGEQKVIYKYTKYQKFDFEDLVIEGESGTPGDLSITSRFQKQFQNRLPYRKNFNPEIRRATERIR